MLYASINAENVGSCSVLLGAGRASNADIVDYVITSDKVVEKPLVIDIIS